MNNAPSKYRTLILLLVAVGSVGTGLFGYEFFYRYHIWTMRAFRAASDSLCPTICVGERVMAEMQGEEPYVPRRGDVIIFQHGMESALFIKRVVGVEDDVIAPGPGNIILVNGQPWSAPAICGMSLISSKTNGEAGELPLFETTRVPKGQVYVIGDNLNSSLDSRYKGFEPVTVDKVRGKPVMIYWSPAASRFGCPIR